jgi:hypothetical protein
MRTINWEQCGVEIANLVQPSKGRFISVSGAKAIATTLLHEVSTISAGFSEDEVIVFTRCAGVSVLDNEIAEYYGLYMASDEFSNPNYCLRRGSWHFGSGSVDGVLKGLSSKTVFFSGDSLDVVSRKFVESVDTLSIEECNLFTDVAKRKELVGQQICYFVLDDSDASSFCKYWAAASTNTYVEKLFEELRLLSNSISAKNTVAPKAGTFRLSYSFGRLENLIPEDNA